MVCWKQYYNVHSLNITTIVLCVDVYVCIDLCFVTSVREKYLGRVETSAGEGR